MLFTWFDHPLIEAWIERASSSRLAQLFPTTLRLSRFRCRLEMLHRNHFSPLCVARVREQHR